MFLKKLKFIVATSLLLLAILGWQHQIALEREKNAHLQQQYTELNQVFMETVDDLNKAYEENESLFNQLRKALLKIDEVEERNEELEQILFNQTQTYRNAVAMKGSVMAVLMQSDFTASMYERAWTRLGARGLSGTGEALVQAEDQYGVNSLVLAAIAYLESGGGASKLSREKNNLFGLGAANYDPYNRALSFSSKEECIFYAARLLSTSYLSRGGRNYHGDNLEAINIRYASDPQWAYKVGRAMARIARAAIPGGR